MLPIIVIAVWVAIVLVAYVALEVLAARRKWNSTWQWAHSLNDWLLSFKKEPYTPPVYPIDVVWTDGSIQTFVFETLAERETYIRQLLRERNEFISVIKIK